MAVTGAITVTGVKVWLKFVLRCLRYPLSYDLLYCLPVLLQLLPGLEKGRVEWLKHSMVEWWTGP